MIAWRSSSSGTSVFSARRPRGADGFSDVVEAVHGVSPSPSPPAPAADVDKDGASPPADCNDNDAKIKPGVKEILGNAVDENCDGKTDPFPKVSASATLSWSLLPSGRTTIRKLTVGGLKKGDVVTLTCKGKGCRKKATGKVTVKGTTASFTSRVKNMTLSPKATLLVKVSRKDAASRHITYTMVKKKSPKKSTRCQDPGSTKVKVC